MQVGFSAWKALDVLSNIGAFRHRGMDISIVSEWFELVSNAERKKQITNNNGVPKSESSFYKTNTSIREGGAPIFSANFCFSLFATSVHQPSHTTPPRSPENPAGRVKDGELSEESRMGMAFQSHWSCIPEKPILRPGVAIAIATEYGVGDRQTVDLRSAKKAGQQQLSPASLKTEKSRRTTQPGTAEQRYLTFRQL